MSSLSSSDKLEANSRIEDNIEKASEGDSEAFKEFLKGLVEGPIFIPDRLQAKELTHQPQYPNELVSILGIQAADKIAVPVFSRVEYIKEWFEDELTFSIYSGKQLFSILPEDWWLIINPKQSTEKEVSPWEIEKIKQGEEGINEILEDYNGDLDLVTSIKTRDLEADEYPEIKNILKDLAKNNKDINKIFLMIEEGRNLEGDKTECLLVGIECKKNIIELEEIKTGVQNKLALKLIGDLDYRVIVGIQGSNIALGVFKNSTEIFKSRKKLFSIF